MLCEHCNENEATIHYTEIVDGVMQEHHLCAKCAQELGITGFGNVSGSDFSFVKLLTGLLASSGTAGQMDDNPAYHIVCPKCGMTYRDFIQAGKFGCAECYSVFGPLVEDNIKKLHGSIQHKGKKLNNTKNTENIDAKLDEENAEKSKEVSIQKKIEELKELLKEAVDQEEYEKAARYRDEIKTLKEGADNA